VKAKAPLTEFLSVVKDTLAEMPKESGNEGVRHQLLHMRGMSKRVILYGFVCWTSGRLNHLLLFLLLLQTSSSAGRL